MTESSNPILIVENESKAVFTGLCQRIHGDNTRKGFWKELEDNLDMIKRVWGDGDIAQEKARRAVRTEIMKKLALVHEEVSEATTAMRIDPCKHVTACPLCQEEANRDPGYPVSALRLDEDGTWTCINDHVVCVHPAEASDHIPTMKLIEEELADTIIRVLDIAYFLKIDIAACIDGKLRYNQGRPNLHGKSC